MGILFLVFQTSLAAGLLWTVSEACRRLFLGPLAHIPGPRLAALTWWYEFYFDAVQPAQYIFKIQEFHQKHGTSWSIAWAPVVDVMVNLPLTGSASLNQGPIIRVTPDELHVNDVGFIDTVYAPSMSRRD